MIHENPISLKSSKLYDFSSLSAKNRGGENMKVTSIMLLKTHIGKMSETGLSIMCMITMHIEDALHYIYDNK